MHIEIEPYHTNYQDIKTICAILNEGGIAIIPTDSVYALVCPLNNKSSIEKLCKLAGKKPEKSNLSIILDSLANIGNYTTPFGNHIFRMMKSCLPGPFTFILNANSTIPKMFLSKRKTIGIRVPDNMVCQEIIAFLGHPLVSASLKTEDEILEYLTDPMEILKDWEDKVDIIVCSGNSGLLGSTIIDCTGIEPEIVREGAGILP